MDRKVKNVQFVINLLNVKETRANQTATTVETTGITNNNASVPR